MTDFIPGGTPSKRTPFAMFIQKYRIENKILLGHMAAKLGMKSSELSKIENDKATLKLSLIDRILVDYPDIEKERLMISYSLTVTSQETIDSFAQQVFEMFDGENSAICVMALLSVIEEVANNDKASAAFRKQTIDLLEVSAQRVRIKMGLVGVAT